MRVTLIHNPGAGDEDVGADALIAALREHGYEPAYWSSEGTDLQRALADPGGLVVVAGGDGTVAGVAKRLAGRGVPLAVIPAGTANNIATSLGLSAQPPGAHAARWATAARRTFDVGQVEGPWGTCPFIESVGCGLFADTMVRFQQKQKEKEYHQPRHDDEEDRHEDGDGVAADELRAARTEMRRVLAAARPRQWHVELDGRDRSGDYLLVEVMNIPRIGPGVLLAPDADPGDGQLDVVFVHDSEDDRRRLDAHLARRPAPDPPPPLLTVRRARHVILRPGHDRVHIDDEACPQLDANVAPEFDLRLDPGALTILT